MRAILMASAIASGCADPERTAGTPLFRTPRVAKEVVPGNGFFVAWDATYQDTPIQTQAWGELNATQYRQYTGFTADAGVLAFATANPGKLYIHGDEPDQDWGSGCIAPGDYAASYRTYVNAILAVDYSAKFSPAGFAEPNSSCCPNPENCYYNNHSTGYAQQFYDAHVSLYGVAPRVDEWRFHNFGLNNSTGDVSGWYSGVDAMATWAANHGAPMVLGSWGFLGWSGTITQFDSWMADAFDYIRNDSRINQAVWWSGPNTGLPWYLKNANGTLTDAGVVYKGYSDLVTYIAGPVALDPYEQCEFHGLVSQGVPPYHYAWTINDEPVGGDSEYYYFSGGSSNFTIRLTATDRGGNTTFYSQNVSVGGSPSECMGP